PSACRPHCLTGNDQDENAGINHFPFIERVYLRGRNHYWRNGEKLYWLYFSLFYGYNGLVLRREIFSQLPQGQAEPHLDSDSVDNFRFSLGCMGDAGRRQHCRLLTKRIATGRVRSEERRVGKEGGCGRCAG